MTAPIFLIETDRLTAARHVTLDGSEGYHAATVRRLRPGERVDVTDGAGVVGECVVVTTGRDRLELEVLRLQSTPRPQPELAVVQALPKGDRGELAVELLTEVGVDMIVPWSAARCVARWRGDRGHKALRRWRSTARESAKQARRSWLPDVRELVGTDQLAGLVAATDSALLLDADAPTPIAQVPIPASGRILLIVGPEGGVTPAEYGLLGEAGARPVRLGPTVLRTSTAGVVAAATVLFRAGRWSVTE